MRQLLLVTVSFLTTYGTLMAQTWTDIHASTVRVIASNRETADKTLQSASLVMRAMGGTWDSLSTPLTIIVADQAMYDFLSPTSEGRLSFFVASDSHNYIVLGPHAHDSEVRHEFTHYLIRERFGQTAPWLDEGLAVALSSMTDDGPSFRISKNNPYASRFSQCGQAVSLENILGKHTHSGFKGLEDAAFYDSAGKFINFLFSRRGVKDTITLLAPAANIETSPNIIGRLFSLSDRDLRSFTTYCGSSFSVIASPVKVTIGPENELTPSQITSELSLLAVRMPDQATRGLSYFRKVLKSRPDDVEALEGAGIGLTVLGKYEDAIIHFRRARALGSFTDSLDRYYKFACNRAAQCNGETMAASQSAALPEVDTHPEEEDSVLPETSNQWSCKINCSKSPPR